MNWGDCMKLFGKEKKELPALFSEAELMQPEVANYESALNYLIGLSDEEFDKVIKVAGFHRKAYQESAAVLGTPNEATTFITPPEPAAAPTSFLDDDEPIDFIEDDTTKPGKKSKQIKVKD